MSWNSEFILPKSDESTTLIFVSFIQLRYKVRGESFKKPGEGIIKIAEDEKVNLIVMGSRGLSKIQRFMIGSVSEYVVRNTRVPCVIVPAEKD